MRVRITYRRKRAFLSLCSFPWSSRPHTHTCRHPPAGNMGFPGRHWLSSCLLSWGRAHRPLSSSLWMVRGCEKRCGDDWDSEAAAFSFLCELLFAQGQILSYLKVIWGPDMKRHMKRTVISLFLYSENHFFPFNYCILDKEFENITQAPVMRSLGVENAKTRKCLIPHMCLLRSPPTKKKNVWASPCWTTHTANTRRLFSHSLLT